MKRLLLACWIIFLFFGLSAQDSTDVKKLIFQPSISATQSFLTQGFDPWQNVAVGLVIKSDSKWILKPGVSYFQRFSTSGYAFTMDSYLFLPSSLYVNIQFRASEAVYLPSWDFAISIFKNIGKFEGSVGIKQLYFDETVTLFPVSLGVYLGNYWISFQNFTGREASSGRTTSSYSLATRRYLATARQYLEFKAGLGQELNILSEKSQVTLIPNQLISLGYQHPIRKRTIGMYTAFTREEIRPGAIRFRTELTLLLK